MVEAISAAQHAGMAHLNSVTLKCMRSPSHTMVLGRSAGVRSPMLRMLGLCTALCFTGPRPAMVVLLGWSSNSGTEWAQAARRPQ